MRRPYCLISLSPIWPLTSCRTLESQEFPVFLNGQGDLASGGQATQHGEGIHTVQSQEIC